MDMNPYICDAAIGRPARVLRLDDWRTEVATDQQELHDQESLQPHITVNKLQAQ